MSSEVWVMIYITWPDKCLIKGYSNRGRGEGSQGASPVDTWVRVFQAEGRANAKALRMDRACKASISGAGWVRRKGRETQGVLWTSRHRRRHLNALRFPSAAHHCPFTQYPWAVLASTQDEIGVGPFTCRSHSDFF